jgi:AraC-like DNA-binding protein
MPALLTERFDVCQCVDSRRPDRELEQMNIAAICFDFDYPNRQQLDLMANTKVRYPSIPILMLTVHHSESLAVWAYRNGAVDFLVKPVVEPELRHCVDRILEINSCKRSQSSRKSHRSKGHVPFGITSSSRSSNDRLAPAIYYVQEHYNERFYSDTVARMCGMSATYFSRTFRQAFDITFQDFVLRYRIAEACRQLRAPNAIITDVASSVGFQDPSYFTRVFKRFVGVPPSDYCAGGAASDNDAQLRAIEECQSTSASQVVRTLSRALA